MSIALTAAWFPPSLERGQFIYEWMTECTEPIICVLEYEPEGGDGWEEPRYQSSACFGAAWLRGVDITCLITCEQAEEIEKSALEKHEKEALEEIAERKWENRQREYE